MRFAVPRPGTSALGPPLERILYGPTCSPNVPADALLDPYDPRWHRELELGRPDLAGIDVAFVIDVSGSMAPAVDWVRREVAAMMEALAVIAREPRIGLTFFGCRGDNFGVQSKPLTGDARRLAAALGKPTFGSGGDELVFDGLRDAVRKSNWSRSPTAAKVVILIGDEEIEAAQMPGCRELAAWAAGAGFRVYGICPGAVPDTYAEVCRLGNGRALVLALPGAFPRRPATGGGGGPGPAGADGDADDDDNPARTLVTRIISAAINPAFRDRVEPLVAVVMAPNGEPVPEAK